MRNPLTHIERRLRARIEAKIRVIINNRNNEPETFIGTISKSGVFLESLQPFASFGERIKMYLCVPGSTELISVVGKVCRIEKPNQVYQAQGIALQFVKVEARQSKKFDEYLGELLNAKGLGCRKYPRAKTRIFVELQSKTRNETVVGENVSNGGLFLRTSTEGMLLGDSLRLVMLHPSAKRKFLVEAQVVHLRKGDSPLRKDFAEGVGVQFIHLTPSRQKDVVSFLKSILTYQRKGGI